MKQIAAFILILAFMAQCFNQTVSVAAFYGNRAAYAKNCINKYRPQLHCNGQCQLMKKLQKQEQQQKKEGLTLKEKTEVQICETPFTFNVALPITNLSHCYYYNIQYNFVAVNIPFHPPC